MNPPSSNPVSLAGVGMICLSVSGCVIGILDAPDEGSFVESVVYDNLFFTMEVQDQSLLQIEAIDGSVTVRGSPGTDEIFVSAMRRVGARTASKAHDHLSDLQVHLSRNPSAFFVETFLASQDEDISYSVAYDIIVPPDLEVDVVQANGTVRIEGVGSDVWVENLNGNVTLDDLVGGVWASVANGTVDSDVFLPHGKTVDQAVGNGAINLRVQTEVSADLSASAGNGTVSISGLTLSNRVSNPNSLTGRFGGGAGFIGLSVGNGWIEITGS